MEPFFFSSGREDFSFTAGRGQAIAVPLDKGVQLRMDVLSSQNSFSFFFENFSIVYLARFRPRLPQTPLLAETPFFCIHLDELLKRGMLPNLACNWSFFPTDYYV